jgi:hypothetical protein
MMTKDIRFKGYLTFADSLKMQRALKPRRLAPPAVLVTVATLAAAALVLAGMRTGPLPALLLLAFLGIFMAVSFRLMSASALKSQQKIYESACIARHGILKTDGIHIKRGSVRQSIRWDHFERVVEIDDILAVVNGGESIGFARYMFNTDSEWQTARAAILERVG